MISLTWKLGFVNSGGFFDIPKLKDELSVKEGQMNEPTFWDDASSAQKISAEATRLREKIELFDRLQTRIEDIKVLHEMALEEDSAEALEEVKVEFDTLQQELDTLEIKVLLSGPNDHCNAIVNIHAGAGGTEACDWANMLQRMYQRWGERHKFGVDVLDILPGEEAGIKSVTLMVKGERAYGYLKAERGVHRLVRISPFNAAGKRQTSFASLDVVAEIDEDIDIEIEEKDLRVDVYRSGGPGGQGVNTTDSAVRITHLPTGMIVTCQNERSQIKNRATAMRVLKARLYEVEMDKKREELEKHYGDKGEIGWGNQIRSYVMQPYQMVKDLRTGEQSSNVQAVMDGDLDAFIHAFLKGKKRSDTDEDLES
ncbi:MAG: peptide chain release factor 2 [Verrucomicrobiota bacterium]